MNQQSQPYRKSIFSRIGIAFLLAGVLFLFGLGACSPALPEITGFDKSTWLADPGGCNNQRADHYQVLLENKSELIGLTEKELKLLLGKPDEKELYQRGQWFYLYYFEPGPTCESGNSRDLTARVQLRISALGKVSEVTFRKP